MNELNLTDVLEAYALAAPHGFDGQILRQMAEKYPQFAVDLQDFAAARAVAKYAPEAEISTADEARYRQIGVENLRAVLSENSAAPESLTDTAKSKGLNRAKFAAALGLSVSLVQYLEKRRLDFATIPNKVIAKVAEVLDWSENVVANYLSQSPVNTADMSFKATTRPEELKPKSFSEAVREDQQLSNEEKRRLLEL